MRKRDMNIGRSAVQRVCVTALGLGFVNGCGALVSESVLAGIHDGAITTSTGIIDGFFAARFGIESGEVDAENEGGGNDLFIGL